MPIIFIPLFWPEQNCIFWDYFKLTRVVNNIPHLNLTRVLNLQIYLFEVVIFEALFWLTIWNEIEDFETLKRFCKGGICWTLVQDKINKSYKTLIISELNSVWIFEHNCLPWTILQDLLGLTYWTDGWLSFFNVNFKVCNTPDRGVFNDSYWSLIKSTVYPNEISWPVKTKIAFGN